MKGGGKQAGDVGAGWMREERADTLPAGCEKEVTGLAMPLKLSKEESSQSLGWEKKCGGDGCVSAQQAG